MEKNKIVPLIILGLIAATVFFGVKLFESGKTTAKSITLAEIAKHNSGTDCWMAIEGNVYDVTSFIADGKHPGGDAILQGCGKDATILFNTRPMGSGTPHSDRARSMLLQFLIGVLAK